jgi:hypothetical protein
VRRVSFLFYCGAKWGSNGLMTADIMTANISLSLFAIFPSGGVFCVVA